MTRKGEGEGRAASLQREGKLTAGIAACAVGAMTSLLLLFIMYTHTHTRKHRLYGVNWKYTISHVWNIAKGMSTGNIRAYAQ